MITCQQCGNAIPDTAAICPSCGTASYTSQSGMIYPTYEQNTPPASYGQGYTPQYNQQQSSYRQPQAGYVPPTSYTPPTGYGQGYPYQVPPAQYQIPPVIYPPSSVSVNVNVVTPVVPGASEGNAAAVIVEVLLTLFLGIYGVGWLMAGETTVGIILLLCTFFLYWPLLIVGTIFTVGLGLICLVPLAIGAVILNAILLHNAIKRKTTYILVQSSQQFPPY